MIAFFDYHDVFEDFYPHYGVTQQAFATQWANTANHAFLSLIQKHVGDVVWYAFSLAPELQRATHELGCEVRFLRSSLSHRVLWRSFYKSRLSWRLQKHYRSYELLASYSSLISAPFLGAILRDKPDCIFTQDYATGRFDVLSVLAKMLQTPLIALHAGSAPERYVGKLAKRWSIPRAEIITSSRRESMMLAERYAVPTKRLHLILTPIDVDCYSPQSREIACEKSGLSPSRRYLLFVGRLDDPVKRVSSIIRSFAALKDQYPNVDLLIAGDGPDYAALNQLATSSASGRIHMLGWIGSAAQRAQLYNAADMLLLPSRSEGFPTVVGEAVACGTPVLASDVGGVSELVIENETGWLIAPGDDGELSRKLAAALCNATTTGSMRTSAREVALERVSPQSVSESLANCFGRAIAAHAPH